MQDYKQLDPTEPLNKSIPSMMESLNSVASGFSGTAFPTENLYVGMRCVRTDQNMEYICTKVENGKAEWTDVNKLTLHAGQAETDGSGNNIEQTYLKKGEAESTYLSKSDASNTYITSNAAAETYFPKSTGEALSSDVASNVTAVKNLQSEVSTTSSGLETANKEIDELKTAIDGIDVSGQQFTLTNSQQGDRNSYATGIIGTADSTITSGSGNISEVRSQIKQVSGITAGTYTLKEILQKLVDLSHSHKYIKETHKYNCNCNCNCDNTC